MYPPYPAAYRLILIWKLFFYSSWEVFIDSDTTWKNQQSTSFPICIRKKRKKRKEEPSGKWEKGGRTATKNSNGGPGSYPIHRLAGKSIWSTASFLRSLLLLFVYTYIYGHENGYTGEGYKNETNLCYPVNPVRLIYQQE
jgi:hypothetical protein